MMRRSVAALGTRPVRFSARGHAEGIYRTLAPTVGLALGLALLAGAATSRRVGPAPFQPPATPAPPAPRSYSLRGVWRSGQTGLESPLRISTGRDGQLYVLDIAAGHAVVLSAAGEVVYRWDDTIANELNRAAPLYPFFDPIDATGLENGDLLILRREDHLLPALEYPGGHQLERYERAGHVRWGTAVLRRAWYGDGTHANRVWPTGLVVDRSGDTVFVLEPGGPTVVAFNLADGRRLGGPQYLPPASTDHTNYEFEWYVDADVMADGRLALLNQARGEITLQRLRWSDGRTPASTTVAVPGRPARIATDGHNGIFVLDAYGFVRRLTARGDLVATWDARGPVTTIDTVISDLAVADDGTVLVANQQAGDIYLYGPGDKPAPEIDPSKPHCRLDVDKVAAPRRVAVGEGVEVRLQVAGVCPDRAGADILLAMERGAISGGRSGPSAELEASVPFAAALIENANLERDRIGILTWAFWVGVDARLDVPLTGDRGALLEGLSQVAPSDDYSYRKPENPCLDLARAELASSHARPDASKVLVLMADGLLEGSGCPMSGHELKGHGTRIVSLMSWKEDRWQHMYDHERDEPRFFMRYLSSGWWDYYEALTFGPEDAEQIYYSITDAGAPYNPTVLLRTMTITDVVAANMAYTVNSASPLAQWDPTRRTLTWHLSSVPLGGVQLHYRLRPLEPGVWPTNIDAQADFVDGLGQRGHVAFPVPRVEVMGPTPSASASPLAPTATPPPLGSSPPHFLPIAAK